MVDDSKNRSDGIRDGISPGGGPVPDSTSKDSDAQPDAIMKLLQARLKLPDLQQAKPSPPTHRIASREIETDTIDEAWNVADSGEMTPAPMVVGTGPDATPIASALAAFAERRTGRSDEWRAEERAAVEGRLEGTKDGSVCTSADAAQPLDLRHAEPRIVGQSSDEREADGFDRSGEQAGGSDPEHDIASDQDWLGASSPPEYHAPRSPPHSLAPPPAAASISIAAEYDPKAPTRPKVRRNTSAPPPPLLFGLDRMLMWGLVLGGIFVATIVVIVHEFALTGSQRRDVAATRGEQVPPDMVAARPSASVTADDQVRGVGAPGSNRVDDSGVHSQTADTGESATESELGPTLDGGIVKDPAIDRPKPAVAVPGKAVPRTVPQVRENNAQRKSWIE